jgi:hypothetical protein
LGEKKNGNSVKQESETGARVGGEGSDRASQGESPPSDHLQVQVKAFLEGFTATNGLQEHRRPASIDASEGEVQPHKLLVVRRELPQQHRGHQLAPAVPQR